MIKFGVISSIENGRAKVKFTDEQIESGFLPFVTLGAKSNKYTHSFDVNEMVVCLMDGYLEHGVILGAVYNNIDTPPAISSKDIVGVQFESGDVMTYDRTAGVLSITVGNINFELASDGILIEKGSQNLKTILTNLLTDLSTEPNLTQQVNYAQYIVDLAQLLK